MNQRWREGWEQGVPSAGETPPTLVALWESKTSFCKAADHRKSHGARGEPEKAFPKDRHTRCVQLDAGVQTLREALVLLHQEKKTQNIKKYL